jgi:hypothetical protein
MPKGEKPVNDWTKKDVVDFILQAEVVALKRLYDDFDGETKRSFKAFWICYGKDITEGKLINFESNWDSKHIAKKWFHRNTMYEKNLMLLKILRRQEIMYIKMKEKQKKKNTLLWTKKEEIDEANYNLEYLVGDLKILAIDLGFPITFNDTDEIEEKDFGNLIELMKNHEFVELLEKTKEAYFEKKIIEENLRLIDEKNRNV